MLKKIKIRSVIKLLESHYRTTTTALKYENRLQLLIATMLSAQSTDVQVNIVTEKLFKKYPDINRLLTLSSAQLERKIKTVGLFKTKAKNIIATCRMLRDEYDGKIPATREELIRLPGVGRKTANVYLSVAEGFAAIAVDTHVFRVSNRIGLAAAPNVERTEQHLMENIPKELWSRAHHWLIWHGRKICKARNPLCKDCFLNQYCLYYKSGEGIRN